MYMQEVGNILDGQFVKIQYDCNSGFERCGKEWPLKLKDAKMNFNNNAGKHICRQCQLRSKNPMKKQEVRDKVKKTTIEKYGVATALNTPENIAARNEKMFGNQEAIDARNDKTKKTNLERYGAEHIMKTSEGVKRLNKTMQEKYGVDFPLQAQECRDKVKETCQERYGVDNPCQLPEVRIAMAKATLEKYGVEYYNQLPEMKDYLREHCKEWLAESWLAGGPNKGKPRPKKWNEKQRETVARLINQGEWHGGYLTGYYKSVKCRRGESMFRSSYELKAHVHLDNNSEVEWYDYEPFQVPYHDTEGKRRYYTVDFVVKYIIISRPLVIEVKSTWARKSDMTKLKYEALLEVIADTMDFTFWSDDEIKALNLDLDILLESSLVRLIK